MQHRHPFLVGDRALKHHHHLAGLQAISQLEHGCAVALEGDLPAGILAAALFQGPLKGCHFRGKNQALTPGRLKLPWVAVVAALQIAERRDLQALLLQQRPMEWCNSGGAAPA